MMAEKLTLRYVPLSTVHKWDRNPKPHDIGKLLQSFERYGFKDPMKFEPTLNDGAGGIVEGNGRAEVLELMQTEGRDPPVGVGANGKQWFVPVLFGVDAKSRAEAEAYAIDHNALTLLGGDFGPEWPTRLYEEDGLKDVLLDLGKLDELPLAIDGDDLDALFRTQPPPDPGAQTDKAEELLKLWKVERGQVWEVGRHRVMCGDATKAGDVETLLSGEKPGLVVADPPYGMRLDTDYSKLKGSAKSPSAMGYRYSPVVGDDRDFDRRNVGIDAPEEFWFGADYYRRTIPSGGSWYVWEKRPEGCEEMVGNDFELLWSRVTHKRRMLRYRWVGYTARETGERRSHPAQKPAALIGSIINGIGKDPVVDPFLGSGTTMVAAEQLGRVCYGMEIEPKYVAVTLQRMADMGLEPKLANG